MTSRFRPLTPDNERRPEDEIIIDLERFEAELAASIAKFDARHGADARLPPKDAGFNEPLSQLPEIGIPVRPAAPPAPTAAPARPHASPPATGAPAPAAPSLVDQITSSADLLGELRQFAKHQAAADESAEAQKKARVERTDVAMRKLFRYLAEFAEHMNRIQPALPYAYRSPVPKVDFVNLHWLDSFIDYRTDGGTEISPLDSISFRFTLGTGKPVAIEKQPDRASAYHDELKHLGIRFKMTEKRSPKGIAEHIEFLIEPSLQVTLLFKAEPLTESIHIRARHLTEYPQTGYREYELAAGHVERVMLDELGKQILGRPSALFEYLKPAKPTHVR